MRRETAVWAATALSLAIVALLINSAGAAAVQRPVGETTWGAPEECLSGEPREALQVGLDLGLGNGYAVPPPGGAITSWSTHAGNAPGQLVGLTVYRPIAPNTYLVVGRDGPRPLAAGVLNTFPVAIPVQGNDLIGLSIPAGSPVVCRFGAREGDRVGFAPGSAPVGAAVSPEPGIPGFRLNVSAAVLPPPTTLSVYPERGSFRGGKRVSIFGDSFSAVQGVSFGSAPALGFEVLDETEIVAVAPPGRAGSRAPITVTTAAGASTLEEAFRYGACRVPRLKEHKLRAAKRRIRRAGCRVGKVRKIDRATARTGRVVKQSPGPGRALAPGARVHLTLGPGPR